MKMCYVRSMLFIVSGIVLCVGTARGVVRAIDGSTFDPPLRPTTNVAETSSGHLYNRVIVEDSTLTGIELGGVLYADVEGATNAVISAGGPYWPLNATPPGSRENAAKGLTLSAAANIGTALMMFEGTVTTETDGGFFIVDFGCNDTVIVYPLDSTGTQIGTWSLTIVESTMINGNMLYPHGRYANWTPGSGATEQVVSGAAFTLGDFTGGSGVLDDVKGLKLVGSGYDLLMAGIYRGPGQSVISLAGRAFKMQSATFSAVLTDSTGRITNDYSLVGIGGAESIAGPVNAIPFDNRSTSYLLYPEEGTPPSTTADALLGLGMNGVRDAGYWDFMFEEPITNANDGFFIIEEAYASNPHFVYPLDADRRPISTYSIAGLPSVSAWDRQERPYLMDLTTKWYGAGVTWEPWGGSSRPSGIIMPLSSFAGGTGGLTNVCGIRIWHTSWGVDPLVVGSYKAGSGLRTVYNVELDPMPLPTPGADQVSSTYRDTWTLAGITLDTGRYTDLEGPSDVALVTPDWEYSVDDPNPPTSAADSALGLDSSGLMNANNCEYYFDTTVTNGFEGGYFVIIDDDNNFTVQPIGTDSNVIAGYSIAVDRLQNLMQIMENDMGVSWTRRYGNGTLPLSGIVDRVMRGTSFTLDCFKNTSGESLTNDVIGVKLTDSPSIDPMIVGIYRGPPESSSPPVSGFALPITDAAFSPPLVGSGPYTNDAEVVSVASIESESLLLRAPSVVNVIAHRYSQTYYPVAGTNPDPDGVSSWTDGYTNALYGLGMDGVFNPYMTEYMFEKPIWHDDDGFFIIIRNQAFIVVRPLAADRTPISSYSVQTSYPMYVGNLGLNNYWSMHYDVSSVSGSWMKGVMIRKSDFAGGTEPLNLIYGIRIEDASREYFDPAVVGQWIGHNRGTMIFIK